MAHGLGLAAFGEMVHYMNGSWELGVRFEVTVSIRTGRKWRVCSEDVGPC